MPESESESSSDASSSQRSSYSSGSFHSDEKPESRAKKKKDTVTPRNKVGQGRKQHPLASQPPTQRNYSRSSDTSRTAQQGGGNVSNNAARKMLSAGRLKINELRNKVTELTVQLANVQTENKQLLRQQRQQERLLAKYDHQENEAPVIVQRINEEASALREQLRRTRERYDLKCEKLHQTSEELDRTQRLLKKMKSLVDDKKLAERDELSRKLSKAQQDIEVKDVTIRDLYKHIENLQKNHRHEIGIERARHRDTQQTLEKLQELDAKLQVQLKEKEKELGVRNIYTLRQNKPPHHLDSSVQSTPVASSSGRRLPMKPKLRRIRPLRPLDASHSLARRQDQAGAAAEETRRSGNEQVNGKDPLQRSSSADLVRQLDEERQMLAQLQADQAAEEEAVRLRQEREAREAEDRERRDAERERERAERERRQLEDERRRAREEAERLTSAEADERRRQKELLRARMKAIDDGTAVNSSGGGFDDVASGGSSSHVPAPSRRALAAADDDVSGRTVSGRRDSATAMSDRPQSVKMTSSKRQVVATAQDENEAVSPGQYCSPTFLTETEGAATSDHPRSAKMMSGKRQVVVSDDVSGAVFGGYRPSFLAGSATSGSAKTKKTSTSKRDAAAGASRPAPRRNLLVFDDDADDFATSSNGGGKRSGAGGELGFLSDKASDGGVEMGAGDRRDSKGHLLPRRPRQQAATGMMNGVASDVTDDVDELIL